MTFSHTRSAVLLGLCTAFTMGFAPNTATAATDCRTLHTVIESALVQLNAQYGGHLDDHLYDVSPRQSLNTTAYPNSAKYTEAWNDYLTLSYSNAGSPNCEGSGAPNVELPLSRFSIGGFQLKKCTAGSSSTCTTWSNRTTGKLKFSFAKVSGSWILTTSYPME